MDQTGKRRPTIGNKTLIASVLIAAPYLAMVAIPIVASFPCRKAPCQTKIFVAIYALYLVPLGFITVLPLAFAVPVRIWETIWPRPAGNEMPPPTFTDAVRMAATALKRAPLSLVGVSLVVGLVQNAPLLAEFLPRDRAFVFSGGWSYAHKAASLFASAAGASAIFVIADGALTGRPSMRHVQVGRAVRGTLKVAGIAILIFGPAILILFALSQGTIFLPVLNWFGLAAIFLVALANGILTIAIAAAIGIAMPIVAVEGCAFVASLKRALVLTRGRRWETFVVLTAGYIAASLIEAIPAIPPSIWIASAARLIPPIVSSIIPVKALILYALYRSASDAGAIGTPIPTAEHPPHS